MRHLYLTVMAVLMSAMPVLTASSQTWIKDLLDKNKGIIDSVYVYDEDKSARDFATITIYYHQPLSHANPQGPQFPMRALFTYDTRKDPLSAVNHVYFSGYNIPPANLEKPDSIFKDLDYDGEAEIAHRYRGNYIQLEHRYFDYSAPDECWKILDYCTAEEAAEDFHAIIAALKNVFSGKWVISGVSKGGITTALQHLFHPEDADIYVPYSAPFYNTDRDTLTIHYWYNNGWNKEYRDMFMNIRKKILTDKDRIYPIVEKMAAGSKPSPARLDSIYGYFLSSTAQIGYHEHTFSDTVSIRKQLVLNDSIVRACNTQFGDTVYAYMAAASTISLEKFQPWIDTLRCYPDPKKGPNRPAQIKRHAPIGVKESEWYNGGISGEAYFYQAQRELGYYECRFDEIMGPEKGAELNTYWKEHFTCVLKLEHPHFASFDFSPSLYNRVTEATKKATKPIVFIYGEDDTWTGGAMKDEFINGTNVRKFILPNQNHNVCFTFKNTDKTKTQAITAILDEVLGQPQGIDEVPFSTEQGGAKTLKQMENGRIIIIRNNEKYDITGKKL